MYAPERELSLSDDFSTDCGHCHLVIRILAFANVCLLPPDRRRHLWEGSGAGLEPQETEKIFALLQIAQLLQRLRPSC